MNLSKVLKITVLSAAVLGVSISLPWAFCDSSLETYALFHCAEQAYIEPVPAGFQPSDVTGVFWQIGFGSTGPDTVGSGKLSGPRDTGAGTDGSSVESGNRFNGNDNGTFSLDVLDAAAVFPTIGFPAGSVCLGSNNWANAGIDGCCDNPRAPSGLTFSYANNYYGGPGGTAYAYASDDNILNPYYGTYFTSIGFPGYYTIGSIMDGPTMVLLTLGSQRLPNTDLQDSPYFALMAVTNMDRGNTGDTKGGFGGCPSPANPATCDIRDGFYDYGAITNGNTNVVTGENNAVPWQAVPKPQAACLANCSAGAGARTIQLDIPAVRIYHDGRSVPTNSPFLDARNPLNGTDATRAAGVGVVDMMARWGGLVLYDVEAASVVLDPNGNVDYPNLSWAPLTDPNGIPVGQGLVPPLDSNGEPTGPVSGVFQVPEDTCLRAALTFGKPAEITDPTLTSPDTCRTGRCGDVGYRLAGGSEANVICIGGQLVSENIANVALDRGQGVFTLSWSSTNELSVQGFDILAVGNRQERKVAEVSCKECTTGLPADYEVVLSRGDLRRAGNVESFKIVMRGGDGDVAEVSVAPGRGRSLGRR